MHEGRPNIVDAIKNGEIQLIINTPSGKLSKHDDSYIRKAAIKYKMPYITTTAGSRRGRAKASPPAAKGTAAAARSRATTRGSSNHCRRSDGSVRAGDEAVRALPLLFFHRSSHGAEHHPAVDHFPRSPAHRIRDVGAHRAAQAGSFLGNCDQNMNRRVYIVAEHIYGVAVPRSGQIVEVNG